MLTLNDGRAELWQWDTGRTLAVDADCSQVHFSNKVFGRSIDVDVVGGKAIIPDVLLQTDKELNVWAFVGTAENGYTKISKTFKVNRRNKPSDYVFTPVEQTTIAEIAAIAQSVRDDADAGLFDGKPGEDGRDGVDGYTPIKGVDYFDGKDGTDGAPGAPGHTPVYGVDYGTPEQIDDIANKAAGILADYIQKISDGKVDKVEGMGLSSNDYDNTAKAKVEAIPEDPKYTDTVYDDTEVKQGLNRLKDDLYNQVEKTLSTNDDFNWQSGWFETDGSIHAHTYFKHSKVFKTVQGSTITFTDLRAPANYIACIACFSGTKYVHDVSLKGEAYTAFSSGTFTVPENIDGVSFVSYVDGAREITSELTIVEAKGDVNAEKIESIETNIQRMESDIAENYNQIYNVKKYTITDGFDIRGSYYDKNGKLNHASKISTTGIINVPLGIKSIEYTAMRDIEIPTILFFGADMGIVGTVIAATSPVYGDTTYSGYADIPSDAVYMEFSANNTTDDAKIVVTVSRIDNNQKRIKILEKDPLAGLKITCTGNSITAATHSVPGHGYVEQIADAHGMTVDNHAIWGAIIPQGHPRASGDITDIGCIHDTLDSMDADADIVVMSGSINDCEYYSDASFLGEITGDFLSELDSTTFYGALENMCKKALQKWAGKPIIYVIEHRMTLDNTQYGQYYLKLHEAIVKVMNKWGISIVDLFNDCPSLNYNDGYRTKYTTGDGTHPNYEGYEKFYVPRVYSEIKKLLGI